MVAYGPAIDSRARRDDLAYDGVSDERVFEQYRRGDNEALRELINRHRDDLFRFLYRLVGDRAAAEDVFQEAFLQIHLSADRFDATRRFRPWLFTIAANKGRDYLRKKVRRQCLELSAPARGEEGGPAFVDLMEIDVPSPDSGLEREELDELVQRALARMSPLMREVLLLAYFQRLSYAQVADDLGIPLGTVKSRLHAAVASFAKYWQEVVGEPAANET